MELAKGTEAWKGHEVLIATHIDRGHIHTHFIVNSVNFSLKNYLMPDMKVRYLSLMVVQMILLLNRFIRRGKLETMESMWVVEMLN